MDSINEEKIIDGVRTEFSYEKKFFGFKGKLRTKTEYLDGKIILSSYTYNENSDIKILSSYHEYTDNWKKDGKCKLLRRGFFEHEGNFKNDFLHGKYKRYWDSETVRFELNFKEGLGHGSFKQYYHNGILKEVYSYENGIPIGAHVKYFENGEVKYKCDWMDGYPINESVYFFSDGKIKEIRTFVDGLNKIRVERFYPHSENLEHLSTYKGGSLSESNNKPRVFYTTDDWGYYYIRGHFFEIGKLNGYHKKLTDDGEIIEDGYFENGERAGEWKTNESLLLKYNEAISDKSSLDDIEYHMADS
jgi:antitoxin component YwqK of YwqJK toxin-antitoxin module